MKVKPERRKSHADAPLRLIARSEEGVRVISALVQDAVMARGDMKFDRKRRRFGTLLNRFRWEDRHGAEAERRPYERVRSLFVVEDVGEARAKGLAGMNKDAPLSLLAIGWEEGTEGGGQVFLTFADGHVVALDVEALEIRIEDVTRPYMAPSGQAPDHGA